MSTRYMLGVDTGGTFTDFVLFDVEQNSLQVHKVLSTPDAPERAILQGVEALGLLSQVDQLHIFHGSTVATNAVLEGKGCKVAYVTNQGFADVLTIGRQARPDIYDLQPIPTAPPVPAELCVEIAGRITATGEEQATLSDADIAQLQQQLAVLKPDAVAVNCLFSWLDNQHEQRIADALSGSYYVSESAKILAEIGEYERGIATWLNAYVSPKVARYLQSLQEKIQPCPVTVMQSSGGTISAAQAADTAVNLLLSGPAGGLAAAQYLGLQVGIRKLMTFDMGGTSSDVALIDGEIKLSNSGHIGPYPVAVPMVDMHTIGAGGGSIAYVDDGGLLQVGPESAGSAPGPACYGNGGTQPTVTDANVILGRIRPENFLGGNMQLDQQAAVNAMQPLAAALDCSIVELAEGIVALANEHMAQALRVISVQRGENPEDYALMSFGGAGGMHVCALADALQMSTAIVPVMGGVLSALGMLVARASREYSQTVSVLSSDVLASHYSRLQRSIQSMVEKGLMALQADHVAAADCSVQCHVDVRYQGQSSTLPIAWDMTCDNHQQQMTVIETAFHATHASRYGHQMAMPIELVTLRVSVKGGETQLELPQLSPALTSDHQKTAQSVPIYERSGLALGQQIEGPAIITEQVSTTWLAEGWSCTVDNIGNLVLQCKKL